MIPPYYLYDYNILGCKYFCFVVIIITTTVNTLLLLLIIIIILRTCGVWVGVHYATDSVYILGWKPELHSFMRSAHSFPGQTTAWKLALVMDKRTFILSWETFCPAGWLHCWKLSTQLSALAAIRHYGAQSASLCLMGVDPPRRFIHPLKDLVFNYTWCLATHLTRNWFSLYCFDHVTGTATKKSWK